MGWTGPDPFAGCERGWRAEKSALDGVIELMLSLLPFYDERCRDTRWMCMCMRMRMCMSVFISNGDGELGQVKPTEHDWGFSLDLARQSSIALEMIYPARTMAGTQDTLARGARMDGTASDH